MTTATTTTFPTITAAHWRDELALARSTPNQISLQIKAHLAMTALALTPVDRDRLVAAGLIKFPAPMNPHRRDLMNRSAKGRVNKLRLIAKQQAEKQNEAAEAAANISAQ